MPKYRRILLKLSGEAMRGTAASGIELAALDPMLQQIQEVIRLGVEVILVIGAGNLIRGEALSAQGFDRVAADQMGILSTVINGLAIQARLTQLGVQNALFSTLPIPSIAPGYLPTEALTALTEKKVVILTAGLGLPLLSTDTTAALRGIELGAEIILKASTVDGVYSADPKKDKKASRFEHLSYRAVLEQRLKVMDLSAFCLCEEHQLPIRVFSLSEPAALTRIVQGAALGTLIDRE